MTAVITLFCVETIILSVILIVDLISLNAWPGDPVAPPRAYVRRLRRNRLALAESLMDRYRPRKTYWCTSAAAVGVFIAMVSTLVALAFGCAS